MTVKRPKTPYEKQIYNILTTRKDFIETKKGINRETKKQEQIPVWSEGDKGIVYDLCTQSIPKVIRLDLEHMDLDKYVTIVKNVYDKQRNIPMINIVSLCINNLNLGYKTKVDDKTIVRI